MERVRDVFEHCKWLIEKGRGEEPGKLFMPRVEAQKRKANAEGYRRVVFQVDEQLYRDWHEQKDRYITLCQNNPPLGYATMLKILAAISDEAIKNLAADESSEDHLDNA